MTFDEAMHLMREIYLKAKANMDNNIVESEIQTLNLEDETDIPQVSYQDRLFKTRLAYIKKLNHHD